MIQFPTDVREGQAFLDKLALFTHQNHQDAENKKVHDEYAQYAASWIAINTKQVQQGLPIEAPKPAPLMMLWNDDGTISHPAFPDLKTPELNIHEITVTKNPFGAGSGTGFAGVNPTGATVENQAMLLMLQHIITELDAIKAKVGA